MPTLFDSSFRHRIRSMTFVDQCVYVWTTVLMRLENEDVAQFSAGVFAETLYRLRQIAPNFPTPLTEARIGIIEIEVGATGEYASTGRFQVVEARLRTDREGYEPSLLCEFYLVGGAGCPNPRTLLHAGIPLPTAAVANDIDLRLRRAAVGKPSNRNITIVDEP